MLYTRRVDDCLWKKLQSLCEEEGLENGACTRQFNQALYDNAKVVEKLLVLKEKIIDKEIRKEIFFLIVKEAMMTIQGGVVTN